MGFCIPYEFNTSDLEACLTFLGTHCTSTLSAGTPMSWKTIK